MADFFCGGMYPPGVNTATDNPNSPFYEPENVCIECGADLGTDDLCRSCDEEDLNLIESIWEGE